MDSMIYSFIIFLFNLDCTNSLKLTHLHVPQSVHRGESTWLNCSYDPGFDKIYSIKWYKNDVEFYRYLPTEKPSIQYYPSSGISIDVSKSVSANVYLTESTFQTEGLYRCEVSADAPSFQTVAREKHLKVYYLPEAGPTIESIKWSYYRDYPVIDLICKSNPSKPSTQLTWLIDNQPSPEQYLSHNVTHNPSGLEVTRLRLTLPYQYGSLVNQFDLRCESRFLLTHVDQLQLTIRSNFFKPQSEGNYRKLTFNRSDNSQSDNFSDDQITKTFNLTIYQDVESNILVKGYQLMYKINDLVNLICQVVKSRAHHKTKPTLKWLINNEEALADMTEAYQNEDFGEYTSRLGFNLSDRFFNMWSTFDNKIGPKIVFKCVAIHEEVLFRSGKDFIPDLQNNVISSARESTHSTNSGSIFRIDKMLTIGPLAITFAFYFRNFKNLFLCLL